MEQNDSHVVRVEVDECPRNESTARVLPLPASEYETANTSSDGAIPEIGRRLSGGDPNETRVFLNILRTTYFSAILEKGEVTIFSARTLFVGLAT